MTTGQATLTLFSSEDVYELIVKRMAIVEGMELAWGLPYFDDEGCLCLEVAFSDEGDPRNWAQKPLAVRQHEHAGEIHRLLTEGL